MNQTPIIEVDRDKLQAKIAKASETLYGVAKAAYGPAAGNVMLGFKHGAPMLSRDGVTNLSQVRLEDPTEDDIIQAIRQVSEKNNKKVGDGTTAVVILAHHLLMAAQRLEGKGFNPMEIAAKLKAAEKVALDYIEKIMISLGSDSDAMLQHIATISAGNPELGLMIADIMKEVGKDGGVVIEQYEGLGVQNEVIDGFYFAKGYKDTDLIQDPATNQSNHTDVPILISNKNFDNEVDIGPVLGAIEQAGFRELVIIGEVNNSALQTLKLVRAKGIMAVTPIDPPYVVGGRSLFLDDLAVMTGALVYNGENFDVTMLGHAKEVLVTEWATSVLGGDADPEVVQERIHSLQEQVKELDHPQSIQFAKDRLARLTGKMAIIRVGGAIEFERDETKLRVQDAVCAVQSSMKEGVVPGGGVTLAKITGTEFDAAFKEPFRQLVINAGLNPDAYLAKLEGSNEWEGFNLRNLTEQPIDLMKEGVLDPSLVAKEIVRNAISVAAGLITASASISQKEKQ